jgi:carbon-monoxide dehydrogenase medium subunit
MASVPVLATAVSEAIASGASIADAAALAADDADPQADLNASVDYRQHLARVLTGRALTAASA